MPPTGATRDTDTVKPDFRGYLSIPALRVFGAYMLKHQTQADGSRRASDNWKAGIPKAAYLSSAWRHFLDWQEAAEKGDTGAALDAAAALWFNVQGWMHEETR